VAPRKLRGEDRAIFQIIKFYPIYDRIVAGLAISANSEHKYAYKAIEGGVTGGP